MPVQQRTKSENVSNKRINLEKASKSTAKYATATQISNALRATENPDVLGQALLSLRNQISLKSVEETVGPADERLALVKQWIESSPLLQELFTIWDTSHTGQPSMTGLVLSTLASILALLSSHYTDHALGHPIMKTLLTAQKLRQLNAYIGGSNNELIIITLKLYNVMSTFAGGREKKAVLEGFGWEIKSLPKLLKMKRKSQQRVDPFVRPDIRSLYITFLLSFLGDDTSPQTKTIFLEQHRDAFLPIFKSIAEDHYSLARKVLEICWSGIWGDNKLKRTLKVGLFGEITIGHLVKLYDRVQAEDEDEDHVPANLVHHFLLAVCTRPGVGICFKDRGWYPREADISDPEVPGEQEEPRKTGKIHNKILSNIIKTLKVNEDSRQQELALKILAACPELVSGYWSSAALTLEPRLSSKWLANIAFFGNIISLSIPSASFYLANEQHNPTPPVLSAIMENVLPSVNTKSNFSKGLLSSSALVQHCTAIALVKCLAKFQDVLTRFRAIAMALEEDEEDGQWTRRCREAEKEARKRVPDFMVAVAFGQARQEIDSSTSKEKDKGEHQPSEIKVPNKVKDALLAESSQRLLLLYQKCFPAMVAEARFDVGKVLHTFVAFVRETVEAESEAEADLVERLSRIQQLHALSLLKESDSFVWTSKIGSPPQSPFYILLTSLVSSRTLAIRIALNDLLVHLLSCSIFFQEDPNEVELWLRALPLQRPPLPHQHDHLTSGYGHDLHDEARGVALFLDDCVQRCLKTPYRYVESLRALASSSLSSADTEYMAHIQSYPSPLLMTVLEQLEAKLNSRLLAPPHIVGVVAFVRKLVVFLTGKTDDLSLLEAISTKLEAIVREEKLGGDSALVSAIRREVQLLRSQLRPCVEAQDIEMASAEDDGLAVWLRDVGSDIDGIEPSSARTAVAWLICDRIRLRSRPSTNERLKLASDIIYALDPNLFPLLLEFAFPRSDLWDNINVQTRLDPFLIPKAAEWLYLHAINIRTLGAETRQMLKKVLVSSKADLNQLCRVVCYIQHGVKPSKVGMQYWLAQLDLLACVMEAAHLILNAEEWSSLKERIFTRSAVWGRIWRTPVPKSVLDCIISLLATCVSLTSSSDRNLLSDVAQFWMNTLSTRLDHLDDEEIGAAAVWVQYLDAHCLFDLLQRLQPSVSDRPKIVKPTNACLLSLAKLENSEMSIQCTMVEHLSLLWSLRKSLPDSRPLEDVLAITIRSLTPFHSEEHLLNGHPVAHLVKLVENRWASSRPREMPTDFDSSSFLSRTTLSPSTIDIVIGMMYICPPAFGQMHPSIARLHIDHDTKTVIRVYHAFLEIASSSSVNIEGSFWSTLIPRFVGLLLDEDQQIRRHAAHCIRALIASSASSSITTAISAAIENLPATDVTAEFLEVGIFLARIGPTKTKGPQVAMVDRGIQWSVRHLEDSRDNNVQRDTIVTLTSFMQIVSESRSHSVDTLAAVVIHRQLASAASLDLLDSALATCHLKPAIVNRHLQAILQHPHFFRLMTLESSREPLTRLLHSLFNLHPTNTSQVTHIEPLVAVYGGTLSLPDRRLLDILHLFEKERKLSIAPLLSRWSATPGGTSTTALESLQSLDPTRLLKTIVGFPRRRSLEGTLEDPIDHQESKLYDPVLILLLFGQMSAEQPPSNAFGWLELLRTNVVSLVIRAISSKDGLLRQLAVSQLVVLWAQLKDADLQEKPHILHILTLLKNVLHEPASLTAEDAGYPVRLPTPITLLLAHALRAVFYPSNFVYMHTANFLLQRPSLDIWDVPMLYSMLYSSSDDHWKKDRTWIIKFIADGTVGSDDWKVLKRRHTWDLLASLFQSERSQAGGPSALRAGILDILANLTCIPKVATSLVMKSALLPWIEMQLSSGSAASEGVEWIRILENILITIDTTKIETATTGQWRAAICRCISLVLDYAGASIAHLQCAAPVILRMALLHLPGEDILEPVLVRALACLERFEQDLHIASSRPANLPGRHIFEHPPHHASKLRLCTITESEEGRMMLWQKVVETLWHTAVLLDRKSSVWDRLGPRLLLLRDLTGGMSTCGEDVGGWVRKELIAVLGSRS